MRMLCPRQCRHSTEELELGEWDDCGGDAGRAARPWTRSGFVPEHDA